MVLAVYIGVMKVLLIEDEPKIAQSIRTFLEEREMEVDCAYDGFLGRAFAERNEYDVIVSDVVMPKVNGIDLCRHFRTMGIRTPILMLSSMSQADDKVLGLEAGADDYLAKPFDFQELLARVKALVRRAAVNRNAFSRQLVFADVELNLDTCEVHRAGNKISLTRREFSLLEYFIRNQGRVVSKSEIIEQVWDIDADISTNVIEVYVNYLRNKIDKGFDRKLIHTQFGVGYILKAA